MIVKMRNRNITLLNMHAALQRYSNKTLDIFGGVYFLSNGVPFPAVMLMWAASFMVRFFLRPLSVWLSNKLGLKWALVIGTAASSGLFLVFTQVNGVNIWLAIFAVYLAFYDILYWLPYHAYYAASGEEDKRGRHVAWGVTLVNTVQIVMPLGGALLATKFGFNYLYASAMICMLLSVIPVLLTRNVPLGKQMRLKQAWQETDRRGFIMSVGNGLVENGHAFLWTIVLFGLAGTLIDFGGLLTIELLFVSIISLVIGRSMDNGKARWAARSGIIILAFVIIARSFWVTTTEQIIISSFVAALGGALLHMVYTVKLYNFAQKTESTLWFHFFGEAGWDIGSTIAALSAAGLFMLGVPIPHMMLLGIVGLLIIDWVLAGKSTVSHRRSMNAPTSGASSL